MECRKCGHELHPEQKVCINCGAPTPAGGGFYVEEDKKWQPTKNMMIGAGAVVLVLLIALIASAFRTMPPDVVAKEWFTAMTERRVGAAQKLVTPKLQDDLNKRNEDLRSVSDDYYTAIESDAAKFAIGQPRFDTPSNPTTAVVTIAFNYPDGHSRMEQIKIVKVGRAWRIDEIN